MKTLHNLNKAIAGLLMFLKSFSGAGFVLIVVFLFDLGTNALGVQVFIAHRMVHMIESLGLTSRTAFITSACFSGLASATLGLVIMQATLHSKSMYNAVLSLLSVCLSFSGLAYLLIDDTVKAGHLSTLPVATYIAFAMVVILSLIPPIAYNMNASLVVENFGKVLDKFNDASKTELELSLNEQVKTLSKEDVARTKKESEKRMKKIGANSPATGTVSVGETIDFDALLNSLNKN